MGGRGNTDGTGSAARFSNPQGVAVDSSGNNAIRKGTVGPQYLWQVDRLRCGPNGNMRLLWRHLYGGNPDGQVSLWTLDNNAGNPSSPTIGPISGWTVAELLVSGNDSTPHLVWTNTTAAISLWRFNASGALENAVYYGPY
jgi:hypothetical protein